MAARLKHPPRKIRLTDRTIRGLKAPEKGQIEYWDLSRPGFGVRVSEGGTKTFVLTYRVGRASRRLTIGSYPGLSLADARELARVRRREIAAGIDPANAKKERREALTVRSLCEQFIEHYAKKEQRRWRMTEAILDRYVVPSWAHRAAKNITRGDVRTLLHEAEKKAASAKRARRGGRTQRNRVLSVVSQVFNWAIAEDKLLVNPCAGIAALPEVERDRVLTESEIKKFWEAAGAITPVMGALLRIQLATAQRGGEVRAMRWDEIDGDWWTIPAEKSKNGLAHRVPISDLAKTILAGVNGDERRVWVFPSPTLPRSHVANQHRAVVAIRKATGLDFQPHDLRRTAASLMAGLGIQRLTIGKVLNHAEPGITSVYDRYGYDREKQGALKAWSKELERIVSGEKGVTSNVVELSNV